MSQEVKSLSQNHEYLPFVRTSISEQTIADVVECLRSGWIATGPKVQLLEQSLQDYLKAPHAQLVTSATAGLHLALLALDVGPGDEVITTPMTFVATLNVIALCGAKPVLIDVEPGTYNIDVKQIEAKITSQTKVIMPVHFAGLPVDLDPLYALAKKYNLRVIEDAAHAIGSEYKGKKIGSFGDIQVFSFHPAKNMTTGEGGCITSHDNTFADKIGRMRFHGIDRDAWNRYSKGGSQHFDVVLPGYKCNMSDLQASIGLDQLAQLDAGNQKRQTLVNRYYEQFQGWEEIILPQKPAYEHFNSWHIFAPLINTAKCGLSRDEFMAKMKEHNIGTGLHYPAVHSFSYYQEAYGYKIGDFPAAEHIGNHVTSLPLFPSMTQQDQNRVITAMQYIFNKR
ncbi:DegT/DnrJ/EryC1/StrS family aminotransferase [Candidatus Paracaedibacter symbiosus]|uniref:DegT/DnrJ/EryC1/StrS family aminotransferase n=1 Tax=Candidatus Paracaedibacter symbiosus TaxID=244582 RepID=UPI00068F34B2|nr:DegT/DnrJ/EryC1/StrS aminotransferase family protein [Candidatus Paracaedibacter symbiosus]